MAKAACFPSIIAEASRLGQLVSAATRLASAGHPAEVHAGFADEVDAGGLKRTAQHLARRRHGPCHLRLEAGDGRRRNSSALA